MAPDRDAQAYALHQQDYTDEAIAQRLDYSNGRAAREAYKAHWRSIGAPDWMAERQNKGRQDEAQLAARVPAHPHATPDLCGLAELIGTGEANNDAGTATAAERCGDTLPGDEA